MAHYQPIPVAVVSYGEEQIRQVRRYISGMEEDESSANIVEMDVLGRLPNDPSLVDRVGHAQDGSYGKTIVSVYGQRPFLQLVKDTAHNLISALKDNSIIGCVVFGNCRHATHRSDVWARTTESMLNHIEEPNGNRVFNAQHFSMRGASTKNAQLRILNVARDWATNPWATMRISEKYGADSVISRAEATATFDGIWSFAEIELAHTYGLQLFDILVDYNGGEPLPKRPRHREEPEAVVEEVPEDYHTPLQTHML